MKISHKFVENVPDQLEDGILYISTKYPSAIHKCFSGCGNEVVTPLSPTDWQLTFDGVSVSLHPSIGNWNLECQSHYWIVESEVIWAPKWTKREINRSRKKDERNKEEYYKVKKNRFFKFRIKRKKK